MENNAIKKTPEKLTIMEFLAKVNASDVRKRLIPQELRYGWPAITLKNGEICITMFYYGMQKIKDKHQYALFPLAYTITALFRTGKIIDFKCLPYDKTFKEVDFNKASGIFPHEALQGMTGTEYKEKRTQVFALYDELIACLTERKPFEHTQDFRELLSMMMEPGHAEFYEALAPKFFTFYAHT